MTTCNDRKLSLEKENIIKDIRNLFRPKKKLNYTAINNLRNIFRVEKETKEIKDRILTDIKKLFMQWQITFFVP